MDVYREIASKVFNVPIDEVTKEQRYKVKATIGFSQYSNKPLMEEEYKRIQEEANKHVKTILKEQSTKLLMEAGIRNNPPLIEEVIKELGQNED